MGRSSCVRILAACGLAVVFGRGGEAATQGRAEAQSSLIATIVVEGKKPFAFFGAPDGRFRKVREGEKMDDGSLLVEVERDHVVTQKVDGTREEVPLFSFRAREAGRLPYPNGRRWRR